MEARFYRDQRPAWTRETLTIGSVSVVVFNLFLFSDYAMNPARFRLFLIFRLLVITPFALGILCFIYQGKRRRLGEILMLSIVLLASLFWMGSYFGRTAGASVLIVAGQIVFLLFGTMVLRVRFAHAAAMNILLVAQTFSFLFVDRMMDQSEKITSATLILACSLLVLVTNYRMEVSQRSSYLLLLREDFRVQDLALLNETLATRSNHDGLTGLANRRYLTEYIQKVCDQARLDGTPTSVIMADLDHFKDVNDSHGHIWGDIVLIGLAEILRSCVRNDRDLVARYGGEEFLIICPGMNSSQACETAKRLCVNVRSTPFTLAGSESLYLSISCGVATTFPGEHDKPVEIIALADSALYRAKHGGRDRAWCKDTSLDTTPPPPVLFDLL